jgi:4-hydroxy-tetrahydrodipicolinate synthase
VNTPLAVEYATYCQKVGADSVIAMPPYALVPDFETMKAYFQAISDAVTIPVWVQNVGVAPMSPDQVVELCTEIENVRWVKEEVNPSPHSIERLVAMNSSAVEGVMGGVGGRYLMSERERGSRGVVHACQFTDLIQRIWDLLDQGKNTEAEDLFEVVLPGLVGEQLLGMAYAKEIMVRRGVLKNHRVRSRANPLNENDMREINRIWNRIEPHLIWHKK